MILQRLVEFYDRLALDPEAAATLPTAGYSLQKLSFCVVLERDGTLQQFQSLMDAGVKRPLPQQRTVPGQAKPSGSGINPGFLWDNAAYMLGFKADDADPERTSRSFSAFREKHLAAEASVGDSAFSAVCRFLRDWSPDLATGHADALRGITGSFGVFRIAGEQQYVHDRPSVLVYCATAPSAGATAELAGHCLVTGETASISRLHEPKIKGVRDAQTAGALLVSFNDDAYTSYGKEQSHNAPVSVNATFKYANALNYLLRREDRRVFLGDATVVFWAERPHPLEGFVSDLFGDGPRPAVLDRPEDRQRADSVRLFLSQLRDGVAGTAAVDPESRTRFYVLGLAPNAARIAVRFWYDTTVAEMTAHLRQHLADVELVGARDAEGRLSVRRIVRSTGRAEVDGSRRIKGYDDDSVSPMLAGAFARAVLTGAAYPEALLAALLNRFKADGVVDHVRVAAIKGCIVRNNRLRGNGLEVSVALDVTRAEPGYATGRLFALLEKIQEDSVDGTLNATIKDRYYSAASATPAVAFPRLLRLSQHHLAKLNPGLKVTREKQLGEIMAKLVAFAPHFGLQDQGLFAIGYFHQRQDLYTSRKDKENAAA